MCKAILSVLFVISGLANAQDLGGNLAKVWRPYGQAYVTPVVNAVGMDMNSGLFHTAKVGGILPFGLSFYVGVQVGGALVPSSDKSFSMGFDDSVYIPLLGMVPSHDTVINAPTIFGSKNAGTIQETYTDPVLHTRVTHSDPTIGGLINTSIALLPIPQVGLGSLFGTDVLVRYLPSMKLASYGKVQLFGFGLRHNVSQYIPLIPIDIAVQLGFQNFSIKDTAGNNLFKLSTFAANVEVSKTLAILTVYGGLQFENSKVNLNYTFTPPGQTAETIPISFSVTGKNKFRALIGLNLGLLPFNINVDYSVGAVSAVTAGLGIAI
ncbi:MAG TPA: DUF6588 family protein [Candidatus Acidoferrales bacterium]|nr:DUF6588 family protein [Candidatus Acidoferrales bacterium]